MSPFIGIVLVLGMLALIFFGPEWVVKVTRKPKRFKKLVRIGSDSRIERMSGRRKNSRIGVSQTPS